MSHDNTEHKIIAIAYDDPCKADSSLRYISPNLTITFSSTNAQGYNAINKILAIAAYCGSQAREATDFGLKRHPDKLSLTFTKNHINALNFLYANKQITKAQKNKMKEHVKPQQTPTLFKSDRNTANTPADENESSNNSCCNSM